MSAQTVSLLYRAFIFGNLTALFLLPLAGTKGRQVRFRPSRIIHRRVRSSPAIQECGYDLPGARWNAPTVRKNEAYLRCRKNEAGLPPYEARLRRTEEKRGGFSLNIRPVGEFCLKVKRSKSLSRGRISPRGVKFRWFFGKGLKKGCLQTFEELSQKYTIVLPQAKCRETRQYCHSLSEKFFGVQGAFFQESPRISRPPLVATLKTKAKPAEFLRAL